MAIKLDKEKLRQLINRPEAFDPSAMEEEMPAPEPEMDSEMEPESEEMEDVMPKMEEANPELLAALEKLRMGEALDSEEVAEEAAGDLEAPTEMRKMAIQKIREKYLGR